MRRQGHGATPAHGSADASFTLKMINDLFSLHLTTIELENYARKLGSDCAFFIENKPVYCFHKGDEFEPVSVSLTGKNIVNSPGGKLASPEATAVAADSRGW